MFLYILAFIIWYSVIRLFRVSTSHYNSFLTHIYIYCCNNHRDTTAFILLLSRRKDNRLFNAGFVDNTYKIWHALFFRPLSTLGKHSVYIRLRDSVGRGSCLQWFGWWLTDSAGCELIDVRVRRWSIVGDDDDKGRGYFVYERVRPNVCVCLKGDSVRKRDGGQREIDSV